LGLAITAAPQLVELSIQSASGLMAVEFKYVNALTASPMVAEEK